MEAFESFAKHAFGAISVRFELHSVLPFLLSSPLVAKRERYRQNGHQLLDSRLLGHVGVFELEAPLLEVSEERFDSPALAVQLQRLVARETVADDGEKRVASFRDPLGREMHLLPEDLVELPGLLSPPPECGKMRCRQGSHEGVALDSNDITHVHEPQPGKPVLPDEFAVHRQNLDVPGPQNGENIPHQGDAVGFAGIAALGALGQNLPADGKSHAVENDGDHQDVDVGSAELPIGAVHRQDPAALWLWGKRENQGTDGFGREDAKSEKALETAIDGQALGGRNRILGKPDQRYSALFNDAENQDNEAPQSSPVQGQIGFEELIKSL